MSLVKDLPQQDIAKLQETIGEVEREEPAPIFSPQVSSAEEETIDEAKQRVAEMQIKLTDWIEAAKVMQKLIGVRLQNHSVRIPPAQNPAVREAIRNVFGQDTDTVTYEMFQKALNLRSQRNKDLLKESEYGTPST